MTFLQVICKSWELFPNLCHGLGILIAMFVVLSYKVAFPRYCAPLGVLSCIVLYTVFCRDRISGRLLREPVNLSSESKLSWHLCDNCCHLTRAGGTLNL